jgi:hypothetical protein
LALDLRKTKNKQYHVLPRFIYTRPLNLVISQTSISLTEIIEKDITSTIPTEYIMKTYFIIKIVSFDFVDDIFVHIGQN